MAKKNGCKIIAHCEIKEQRECKFYEKKGIYSDVCSFHGWDGRDNLCLCTEAVEESVEEFEGY